MRVQQVSERIIKVVVDRGDCDLDAYYDDLFAVEKHRVLTFGDSNFRVLGQYFRGRGFSHETLDLCLFDDQSIGLAMPGTWYLNKGKHAVSIAMYYNYLTFHGIVERRNLSTFNKAIARDYGRVACMEIYTEDRLTHFLDTHDIEYFGTPRTLTECVRFLEGWNVERYPRLNGYAAFAKYIELWSRVHFPQFNADEWYCGKTKSRLLNSGGRLSNVRRAVRYFWENHLLCKPQKIAGEDVEIDILGGKFHAIRRPQIILMSEDLFSRDNSTYEIFKNLTRKMHKRKIYLSRRKNDFPLKNAMAARSLYPGALVVLLEYEPTWGRNFSLINPVKQTITEDVIATTRVLRHILDRYLPDTQGRVFAEASTASRIARR